MKKQLPAILLAIICVVLAAGLYRSKKENAERRAELALNPLEQPAPQSGVSRPADPAVLSPAADPEVGVAEQPLETTKEVADRSENNRRIMRNMAKTIEENPTVNKMVVASQRGAIGALYSDMIEYLDLDEEETQYFMELLMYRQMANVDAHMKMASGTLAEEEKLALQEEMKRVNETMRSEMDDFLNDPEDFEEFVFYEETIGERMMLSQMDQKLGNAALSDKAYREVLKIMYDERTAYDWSTDLHDNENRDLSPDRFSQDNISKHIAEMKTVGELMEKRVQAILTPEQLEAWRESGAAMQTLVEGQLIQANQMFGSE